MTPLQYVLVNDWDLLQIAENANGLSDEEARKADEYVEGGSDALFAYCWRRVWETVEYRAD